MPVPAKVGVVWESNDAAYRAQVKATTDYTAAIFTEMVNKLFSIFGKAESTFSQSSKRASDAAKTAAQDTERTFKTASEAMAEQDRKLFELRQKYASSNRGDAAKMNQQIISDQNKLRADKDKILNAMQSDVEKSAKAELSARKSEAQQEIRLLQTVSKEKKDEIKENMSMLDKARGALSQIPGGNMISAFLNGPTALVAGGALAGKVLYGVGTDFQNAYNLIRQTTGKTEKDLEGLKGSFRTTFGKNAIDSTFLSETISDINKRTGATGPMLEMLAGKYAKLKQMNITPSIEGFTRALGDWNIPLNSSGKALDYLFKASQLTGVSIEELQQKTVYFGAPMRTFGFSFEETALLMGRFQKEGVNTEVVMASMRLAAGKFAKENIPLREGLEATIKSIKGAKTASEGAAIAVSVFGRRAGVDMADTIRHGKFEIEAWLKTARSSPDTIDKAAADTLTASQKMMIVGNKLKLIFEPMAKMMIDAVGYVADGITVFVDNFQTASDYISKNREYFILLAATIGTITLALTASSIATGIASAATGVYAGVQAALNAVMAINPIALVIIAIAALVAGIIYAYNHSETFRGYVNALWEVLKAVGAYVGKVFVGIWRGLVDAFKFVWSWILKIINVYIDIYKWIGKIILSVVEWGAKFLGLGGVFEKVKKWVTDAIGVIVDAIKSVGEFLGLIDDASDKVDKVANKSSGFKLGQIAQSEPATDGSQIGNAPIPTSDVPATQANQAAINHLLDEHNKGRRTREKTEIRDAAAEKKAAYEKELKALQETLDDKNFTIELDQEKGLISEAVANVKKLQAKTIFDRDYLKLADKYKENTHKINQDILKDEVGTRKATFAKLKEDRDQVYADDLEKLTDQIDAKLLTEKEGKKKQIEIELQYQRDMRKIAEDNFNSVLGYDKAIVRLQLSLKKLVGDELSDGLSDSFNKEVSAEEAKINLMADGVDKELELQRVKFEKLLQVEGFYTEKSYELKKEQLNLAVAAAKTDEEKALAAQALKDLEIAHSTQSANGKYLDLIKVNEKEISDIWQQENEKRAESVKKTVDSLEGLFNDINSVKDTEKDKVEEEKKSVSSPEEKRSPMQKRTLTEGDDKLKASQHVNDMQYKGMRKLSDDTLRLEDITNTQKAGRQKKAAEQEIKIAHETESKKRLEVAKSWALNQIGLKDGTAAFIKQKAIEVAVFLFSEFQKTAATKAGVFARIGMVASEVWSNIKVAASSAFTAVANAIKWIAALVPWPLNLALIPAAGAAVYGAYAGAKALFKLADGGVFTKPVYSPLISGGAVVGEAGPEAFIPLKKYPGLQAALAGNNGSGNDAMIRELQEVRRAIKVQKSVLMIDQNKDIISKESTKNENNQRAI